MVPTLALLAALAMPVAIGTSLLVIAMNALAGLAGQVTTLSVDWKMAAMVTAAAVLGSRGQCNIGRRRGGTPRLETVYRSWIASRR